MLARGGSANQLGCLFGLLTAVNLAAWGWAWHAFHRQPSLLGVALLAWVFGLRHAVDADHIAAIDNVVRKLMQDGKRPYSAGFWFSLGHSTIVILASLGIAVATATMQNRFEWFKSVGGVIGTSVSAVFLLLIAGVNLLILRGVWRDFRVVANGGRAGDMATATGLLVWIWRPLFKAIGKSWHMYPLGFLFGLGFDTATEVGLLGIAAGQAAQGMSAWSVLVFPALFTAGMALVDTADSVMMTGAYGWAFVQPLRKLWYNLTITAASVMVALLIGGIEALGLLVDQLGLEGRVWDAVAALNDDLTNFGFAVVGIFAFAWCASAAVYRWKGYDSLVPVRK